MATKWTIYNHSGRSIGADSNLTCVLLTDGAWTDQNNCNRRDQYAEGTDPIVMCRPRLFATKGGAMNYKRTRLGDYKRYRVAKYTGPTNPDDRPVREVWRES